MIKRETVTINEREFTRTYSDAGFRIRKVGTDEIYDDAVDILDTTNTYEETEELIEVATPSGQD